MAEVARNLKDPVVRADLPLAPSNKAPTSARNAAAAAAWRRVGSRLAELAPTTLDGSLHRNLRQIEVGFAFVAEPEDDDFCERHVEPLLDQAADLLDRGVRDRATYDDLASKRTLLALELAQFKRLDDIHDLEEQYGYYEVDYKQASHARAAEKEQHAGAQDGATRALELLDEYYDGQSMAALIDTARHGAWIGARASFKSPGPNQSPVYLKHSWKQGTPRESSRHAQTVAVDSTWRSLDLETHAALTEHRQFVAAARAANSRMSSLEARRYWEWCNLWFARWRAQAARDTYSVKAAAVADPDGALNYGKRLDALQGRFQLDFRSAIARLQKVSIGMQRIYGYNVPLPANPADLDYFDQCLYWNRAALQWLIRFTRREQCLVLPISIRRLVGEAAWAKGRSTHEWSFNLSAEVFASFSHVRMRGISAATRSTDEIGKELLTLGVRVPRRGTFVHLTGAIEVLNQSDVPMVWLPRVSARTARRLPDVLGISALHNVSPIGRWTITAPQPTFTPHRLLDDVDDIEIELHLAFRAAR